MSSSRSDPIATHKQKKKTTRCIGCHADVQENFKPFCSVRCQNLDLHHWLTGTYAVPVIEEDGAEDYSDDGF